MANFLNELINRRFGRSIWHSWHSHRITTTCRAQETSGFEQLWVCEAFNWIVCGSIARLWGALLLITIPPPKLVDSRLFLIMIKLGHILWLTPEPSLLMGSLGRRGVVILGHAQLVRMNELRIWDDIVSYGKMEKIKTRHGCEGPDAWVKGKLEAWDEIDHRGGEAQV